MYEHSVAQLIILYKVYQQRFAEGHKQYVERAKTAIATTNPEQQARIMYENNELFGRLMALSDVLEDIEKIIEEGDYGR